MTSAFTTGTRKLKWCYTVYTIVCSKETTLTPVSKHYRQYCVPFLMMSDHLLQPSLFTLRNMLDTVERLTCIGINSQSLAHPGMLQLQPVALQLSHDHLQRQCTKQRPHPVDTLSHVSTQCMHRVGHSVSLACIYGHQLTL